MLSARSAVTCGEKRSCGCDVVGENHCLSLLCGGEGDSSSSASACPETSTNKGFSEFDCDKDSEGDTVAETESLAGVIGNSCGDKGVAGGCLSSSIACRGTSSVMDFSESNSDAERIGDAEAGGETGICRICTGEKEPGVGNALSAAEGEVGSAAIADRLHTSEGVSSSVKDSGVEGYAPENCNSVGGEVICAGSAIDTVGGAGLSSSVATCKGDCGDCGGRSFAETVRDEESSGDTAAEGENEHVADASPAGGDDCGDIS